MPDVLIRFSCSTLRAEIAAVGQAIRADDRQRDVMSHAGLGFGAQQMRPAVLKKFMTAASSNDGEFATSTTTCAPASTESGLRLSAC